MVFRKRKKNVKQRAGTTHGWGSMKKHRGKGNKGGAGKAGTGKRGDAKKPSIWKKKYFGKFGFKKKGEKIEIIAINIDTLVNMLGKLVAEKKITQESETFIIDLSSIGYNKLLGRGKTDKKLKITVDYASATASEKISSAGGEVITLNKAFEESADSTEPQESEE
jgi:large subunit ribosomal protein L15